MKCKSLRRKLLASVGKSAERHHCRADALKSIQKYWTDQGMDDEGVKLFDGSGLSTKNKMTAKAMSKVLYSIHKDSSFTIFIFLFRMSPKQESFQVD
ncbi:MAG: D-alanyl-D-alanine carboxypeptidase [Saprospiraceae bacterium]|nr:D-alanyl-D-alanine carboxypeptidase [Candidatus Vicinibacter affinis]